MVWLWVRKAQYYIIKLPNNPISDPFTRSTNNTSIISIHRPPPWEMSHQSHATKGITSRVIIHGYEQRWGSQSGEQRSHAIITLTDDTTVLGLIRDNDETAYREALQTLTRLVPASRPGTGNRSAHSRESRPSVVWFAAQHIAWNRLLAVQDIFHRWGLRKADSIIMEHSHPAGRRFSLCTQADEHESMAARTTRRKDSFYLQGIRLLNSLT